MDHEFEYQEDLQPIEPAAESFEQKSVEEPVQPLPQFEPSSEYRWVRPEPVKEPDAPVKKEKKGL